MDGKETSELRRLIDDAKKDPSNVDRQRAVYEAAKLQADSGDIDGALLTVKAVSHPELHATMLAHISARLVNLGQKERSAEVFAETVRAADRVPKADKCSFAINLGMTAHQLAQRGLHETILGPVLQSTHEDLQASLLYWTAAGLAVEGHFDRALEISNSIRDRLTRGRSLQNIAVMLNDRGQKERASELFKEAARLVREGREGEK